MLSIGKAMCLFVELTGLKFVTNVTFNREQDMGKVTLPFITC